MSTQQLICVVVLFLLSLLAAYVLFKVLKSSALIKRPGYQAGGALAGFLLIFGILSATYLKLVDAGDLEAQIANLQLKNEELKRQAKEQANQCAVEYWTVRGTVVRHGETPHRNEGISVGMIPHETTTTGYDGRFALRNIKLSHFEQFQRELQFSSDGYFPDHLIVNEDTAV